jgi:hypothetical protein
MLGFIRYVVRNELTLVLGVIVTAKTSREFYRDKENCPIKFLESTNYYLLKLSRPVEILELLPRVRSRSS